MERSTTRRRVISADRQEVVGTDLPRVVRSCLQRRTVRTSVGRPPRFFPRQPGDPGARRASTLASVVRAAAPQGSRGCLRCRPPFTRSF